MDSTVSTSLRTLGASLFAACVLAGCGDGVTRPVSAGDTPNEESPVVGANFTCTVSVDEALMRCATASDAVSNATSPAMVSFSRVIGGQDIYVKLASSGTVYDAGTETFASDVTLQNLAQSLVGTGDGTTVDGISVFLYSGPTVVSGTGSVSLANADGNGTFTASDQPYFLYSEILEPYQISSPRRWQFSVPATVGSFEFSLYVSVPMEDEDAPLLDAVWSGTASGDWAADENWASGSAPGNGSVVAVPRSSLLPSGATLPTLAADDTVSDLRVGEISTLALAGHTLLVTRNLDALGTISGGTVRLTGTNARIGGNLPALEITSAARLQRPVVATGPVSVTGALSVSGHTLTITNQ